MNLLFSEPINAMVDAPQNARQIRRYLLVLGTVSALLATSCLILGLKGHDHFASYPLNGDTAFYRNISGRAVMEIQDQELFYHNIGGSVTAAKAADIVALGPSFVASALEQRTLRQFEAVSGHHIYNMAFVGVRGGEFSRRIITRWGIRAPLWVINADDQFIHFFSRSLDLTLGSEILTIPATTHGRIRGYLSTAARNLRWRAEDYVSYYTTGDGAPTGRYRNIATGDSSAGSNPKYATETNPEIPFNRSLNCRASPETIEIARQYLRDIGGQVVLTLVPHSQYCPAQAFELAKALGVEILIPPDAGYTSADGGGHLDKRSAEKFTRFLFSELPRTNAYRRAFGEALHETRDRSRVEVVDAKDFDPAGPTHTPISPRPQKN